MKHIDLGRKEKDYSAPVGENKTSDEGEYEMRTVYPQITICDADEVDLPKKGKAVIEYEIVSFRKKGYMKDGPEIEIEVKSISPTDERSEDDPDKALEEFFKDGE